MHNAAYPCSAPRNRERGFTLVEVIVVLSVVLLLTGIAVPMLTSYMEDGRRARAEAECKVLGAAVMSLYKDVGVFPARSATGVNNTVNVLLSGTPKPTANPYAAAHQWATWGMNATLGDILDNHLLLNTPNGAAAGRYPITGSNRWRGPYTAGPAPFDPWGRPYIINVISGWSNNAVNYKRLYVLSAGQNGVIDTVQTSLATTNIGGDDVGFILSQRQ